MVAKHGKGLIVDAMSSFGAIEIDARKSPFDAVIGASGKCLEGVPGMGFILMRRAVLEKCEGNAHSLAMDLYDQWVYMEKTTQWRYTPPTHVVAALDEAIRQFEEEGGVAARGARYAKNCEQLISGMQALGFSSFLPRAVQAPIIVTFHAPGRSGLRVQALLCRSQAARLHPLPRQAHAGGDVPRRLHRAFRPDGMNGAVAAIADTIKVMGIKRIAAAA